MKVFMSAVLALLIVADGTPPRRVEGVQQVPTQTYESPSPYGDNIFGGNRSGVAQPQAPSEGGSIRGPAQNGAPTGGTSR